MDRNALGENSAELSFPVGKIEYKVGQEVWGQQVDGLMVSPTSGLEGQLFMVVAS